MMKELECYLGAKFINSYQPVIMNKTLENFANPEITTTMIDTGAELPESDVDMTYLNKKNTNDSIHKKLRKRDVYENDMHNI